MTREQKIDKLLNYFFIGFRFLNGGKEPPIDLCVETQMQLETLSDELMNSILVELKKPSKP